MIEFLLMRKYCCLNYTYCSALEPGKDERKIFLDAPASKIIAEMLLIWYAAFLKRHFRSTQKVPGICPQHKIIKFEVCQISSLEIGKNLYVFFKFFSRLQTKSHFSTKLRLLRKTEILERLLHYKNDNIIFNETFDNRMGW